MANTAITQHLVQAHQHLDAIQGEIEKSGDTESLAAMKEVNDRLDAAKKQHAALQAATKPGADPSVVAGQAEKLQQSLDRSIESHDALLEKLKIPPPDAASP
jgi:Zn-dependent oligopeptidase